MLIGAHMSIAGGVFNSITRGSQCGCNTIQIFTKSNNQWKARELEPQEIAKYKELRDTSGIGPVVAHDSYLINLGAPDEELYRKSMEAFYVEMLRCEALEIPYLVMHPGNHIGTGEETGLKRIAKAINDVHKRCQKFVTRVTLEVTAGQGTAVGYKFEHIARLLELIVESDRLAVCLDTCHLFAAGYDFRTASGYKKMIQELDRLVGIKKVKVIHVNDCKKPLGCRVDRHEHIGKGTIGLDGFRHFMEDERFKGVPKILETPKKTDGDQFDQMNLATLRSLAKE